MHTRSFALLAAALAAAPHGPAMPPTDLQSKLDEFVADGGAGVAVAWVDRDGQTFLQAGRFSADDPRPITPDTEFEVGSVTKVFTSILLAESERAGKVSRTDPAAKFLLPADDPAQASLARITLLSLATHTSGLPRLPTRFATAASADPYAQFDDGMLADALRRDGPVAPVGSGVAYSNFGGAVLGEALAKAWGTSYAAALRTHVLMPLGLGATTLGLAGEPAPAGLAPVHANGKTVPPWTFRAFAPAGALRSSARDLARFLSICLRPGDNPLAAALKATFEPQCVAAETGGHVGLGWFITPEGIIWHNGATAGSHAFVGFNPRTGTAVAILANFQKASEPLGFGLLGGQQPRPTPEAIENRADYVGRYALNPAFAIRVTEWQEGLRLQATAQPPFGLRRVAADRFAVVGVTAEVSFERDAAGKVIALVLHQNGIDQRGPRGALPSEPKEITVPTEALREYLGSYPVTPAFILAVTEEKGNLYVQATNQPRFPVYASSKDEFFYRVVDAQITFERDGSGKVTGLVLHQAGRNLPAKRTGD